jgi:flagellar protein FliT
MNSSQIITTYEAIQATTGKMLVAAQNGEWDTLVILEQECRKLTEQLIQNKSEPELSDELLHKKVKIIHQVLEDDSKIRSITEPWMGKLNDILNTTGRKRDLHRAYQSD